MTPALDDPKRLRERIAELQDRITALEKYIYCVPEIVPPSWQLTKTETKFVAVLMHKDDHVPYDILKSAVWGSLDQPGLDNRMRVTAHNVKPKLRAQGYRLDRRPAFGYALRKIEHAGAMQ